MKFTSLMIICLVLHPLPLPLTERKSLVRRSTRAALLTEERFLRANATSRVSGVERVIGT